MEKDREGRRFPVWLKRKGGRRRGKGTRGKRMTNQIRTKTGLSGEFAEGDRKYPKKNREDIGCLYLNRRRLKCREGSVMSLEKGDQPWVDAGS